ncbi:MAG TPA: hypothetical protein VF323_00655 [Candidatus Limnocylindrales bacterium]
MAAIVRAAGAEPVATRAIASLVSVIAGGVDRAIVDLTARAYDGVEAVAAAVAAGAAVLAVGQHDDVPTRRRALAAGATRVVPYRLLAAPAGPATVARWSTAAGTTAGGPRAGAGTAGRP